MGMKREKETKTSSPTVKTKLYAQPFLLGTNVRETEILNRPDASWS